MRETVRIHHEMEVHSVKVWVGGPNGKWTLYVYMNRGNGTLSSTGHGLSILVALLYGCVYNYDGIPSRYPRAIHI